MVETSETIIQRLTRLEEAVEDITLRLSWIVNELETDSFRNRKQDAEVARKILS